MKKIYVIHPYQNKPENFEIITEICRKLAKRGYLPISPVHSFSYLNDLVEEERLLALEFCEELLTMCDEVWVFGDWEKSEGCKRELKAATLQLKTIRIIPE